jgi:thiamine-monophosphate kinase
MMDENQIVRRLRKRFGTAIPGVIRGIGDDAAVLRPPPSGSRWVVTTDMLLEGVDFLRSWATPAQLGHKSLAVNLSDLAAMGAQPRFYLVALALPSEFRSSWIDSFYRGITRLAQHHGAGLIGGDLSRSPAGIQVTITAIGETSGAHPVYRSGGRPGDRIYVTGILGQAAAGLDLMMHGKTSGNTKAERLALRALLVPEPRCEEGLWLARSGYVRCMMDLSDGISMDLARLCEASAVGAEIDGEHLPVFHEARKWHCDPLELALHGGEDFELLFTVPARKAEEFEAAYPSRLRPPRRIGSLTRERRVYWRPTAGSTRVPLRQGGFDHFRGSF